MLTRQANELKDWFLQVLDVDPEHRDAFIDAQCPVGLRLQVRSLLRSDRASDTDWLEPAHRLFAKAAADSAGHDLVGTVISHWVLAECIGEGGMSAVYRAVRNDHSQAPEVAIKIMQIAVHSDDRRRWFEREHKLLATLSHPNICRFLDAGIERGQPYLVMELIVGKTFLRHVHSDQLGLRGRLELFRDICKAVAYAHSRLIVHRDLKPGNILVNAQGTPKLLDFGIAKWLTDEAEPTRASRAMLTPEYAAPEQLAGDPVSTATDVYALGVILFELLAGERPARDRIRKPSEVVNDATTRRVDNRISGMSRAQLRGDLDNIILRACAAEPERRYIHAGELADDIDRYLQGMPVSAHPPSRWYVTGKFLRRHRGAVLASVTLGIATIAALGVATWQAREAHQQLLRAEAARDFLIGLFDAAQQDLPKDAKPTPAQLVEQAAERLIADKRLGVEAKAELFGMLSLISYSSNDYGQSLRQADLAIESLQQAGIRSARDVMQFVVRKARALTAMGDAQRAVQVLSARLAEHEAVNDAITVEGFVALSDAKFALGDVDEAINSMQRAVQLSALVHELDEQIKVRAAQADLLASAGRNKEAAVLFESVLAQWRTAGLPLDSRYANSLQNLATAYYHLGDLQQAEAQMRDAYALLRSIHTGDHEKVADVLSGLAVFAQDDSRFDEAEQLLKQAAAMYTNLFEPNHPQNISMQDALSQLEVGRGNFTAAVVHGREATRRCADPQMAQHPDCGRYWQNLSHTYLKLDRLPEAEDANLRGLQLRERIFGSEHPALAGSLSGRASVLLALGKPDLAMQQVNRALAIFSANGQMNSLGAATMMRVKAHSLSELKRWVEALEVLDQSDRLVRELAPDELVHEIHSSAIRAEIHAQLGNSDLARAAARAVLRKDPELKYTKASRHARLRELAQ